MERQLREGFAGQEMFVIPRPVLAEARRHPLVRGLFPTDIGWYPQARYHYRDRVNGAPEDHLMMCLDGHGYAVVNGKKSHLRAGELLIIPRNCPHTYWAAEDKPWSIYWMHFRGEDSSYYVDRIPQVAIETGYVDPYYFSRCSRKSWVFPLKNTGQSKRASR